MDNTVNRQIYTVSGLTDKIKDMLEDEFPFVWIIGEIANCYIPASGHCYFDLKDESSQIKAIIFRRQAINLKFDLEDGLEVTGFGRISLYAPRGTYQIILEYIDPAGVGALRIAFEQLKRRLEEEELFDASHKSSLPKMPRTIGVVTSLSGAVIHDMVKVLFRRFENIHLIIAPAKVQGINAENEIAEAIEILNQQDQAEIIVLARGGGSLEDLMAFNSEIVARAIFASRIPIVSAVGHETDFTISDFTADFRAPTPSTAAEIIVPEKREINHKILKINYDMVKSIKHFITNKYKKLQSLTKSMKTPKHRIEELRLKIDHLTNQMTTYVFQSLQRGRHRASLENIRLNNVNPVIYIHKYKVVNDFIYKKILIIMRNYAKNTQYRLKRLEDTLVALNPMAILQRGYSITRTAGKGEQQIIMNSDLVDIDQHLEILLAKGLLRVKVQDKFNN